MTRSNHKCPIDHLTSPAQTEQNAISATNDKEATIAQTDVCFRITSLSSCMPVNRAMTAMIKLYVGKDLTCETPVSNDR